MSLEGEGGTRETYHKLPDDSAAAATARSLPSLFLRSIFLPWFFGRLIQEKNKQAKKRSFSLRTLAGLLVVLFPRREVVRLETTIGSRLLRCGEGGWPSDAGGACRPLWRVEEQWGFGGGEDSAAAGAFAQHPSEREQDPLGTRRGEGEIHHFNGAIFSSWQKQGGGRRLRMLPFPVVNAALGDNNLCS